MFVNPLYSQVACPEVEIFGVLLECVWDNVCILTFFELLLLKAYRDDKEKVHFFVKTFVSADLRNKFQL